jgi:Rad3-related DNA helicase
LPALKSPFLFLSVPSPPKTKYPVTLNQGCFFLVLIRLSPSSLCVPLFSSPSLSWKYLVVFYQVFDRFRSVIITSGTLSPLDLYPKLLGFQPKVIDSLPMSLTRNCICPMIITKGFIFRIFFFPLATNFVNLFLFFWNFSGDDQQAISSRFETRLEESNIQNNGKLLIRLAETVPDGLVCFFPSYRYMEEMIMQWDTRGILKKLKDTKLIFIETKDVVETTLALHSYKKACDCGRGALFFSVSVVCVALLSRVFILFCLSSIGCSRKGC